MHLSRTLLPTLLPRQAVPFSTPAAGELIVSRELSLDQAADGSENFDDRADGWTMVVLRP